MIYTAGHRGSCNDICITSSCVVGFIHHLGFGILLKFCFIEFKLQDLEEWKLRSREELAEQQKQITELSMASLDAEIEKWKNGPPGRNKAPGATPVAESNTEMEMEGGDGVPEGPQEASEVVEDEDDETGAMLIEDDEERVTVGDPEVNKLVTV